MKILFVGGDFNINGGRPSGLVNKFAEEIKENHEVKLFNGGRYEELSEIIQMVKDFEVVIWWANVPNELEKIRNIKEINYKVMLVTSKRNVEGKYSFQDLLARTFATKSNLCVEFTKLGEKYNFMVFDPLGNVWANTTDISVCAANMMKRIAFLKSITRQSTTQTEENAGCLAWFFNSFKQEMIKVDGNHEFSEREDFLDLIKHYAVVFAKETFQTDDAERFLGNASFRCPKGFPSFRDGKYIFVSRRNVNKKYIEKEDFVPVFMEDNKIYYHGNFKPSVDTPIQVRLYNQLKNINYMIHSHCYIKGAPFTNTSIPCGAIEEVDEIMHLIDNVYRNRDKEFYVVNLKGHGSIMMAKNVEMLKNIKIEGRTLPEIQ